MTYTYVILTWDRCCLVMTVLSAITSRIRKYFREEKKDRYFLRNNYFVFLQWNKYRLTEKSSWITKCVYINGEWYLCNR